MSSKDHVQGPGGKKSEQLKKNKTKQNIQTDVPAHWQIATCKLNQKVKPSLFIERMEKSLPIKLKTELKHQLMVLHVLRFFAKSLATSGNSYSQDFYSWYK